jgi:hypothetical protein
MINKNLDGVKVIRIGDNNEYWLFQIKKH